MPDRRYRVTGRVQGVGFRWWTRGVAVRLGLTGWVRNQPDGSVLAAARGSDAALAAFEAELRGGPPGARVALVEMEPAKDIAGESFEIVA